MVATHETRPVRALRCPVPGCGEKLAEVAGDGALALWRHCPACRAVVRFDLPAGRATIEQGPRRR